MNINRCFLLFIIGIFLLGKVFALNLGISPVSINFSEANPGEKLNKSFFIFADSDKPVDIELEVTGESSEWISLSEKKFETSKNEPYEIKMFIDVPKNAEKKDYLNELKINVISGVSEENKRVTGNIESSIKSEIILNLIDKKETKKRGIGNSWFLVFGLFIILIILLFLMKRKKKRFLLNDD